jgi:hypothetical protein
MAQSIRNYTRVVGICFAAALFGVAAVGVAQAQTEQVKAPAAGALILGEIESVTVDDMNDPSSGGRMVVKGKQITIPKDLLIGLPKGRMTLRNLVLDAPEACKALQPPQSGLAVSDTCRNGSTPALARIVAKPAASGELVASLVMVQKNSATTLARFSRERRSRRSANRDAQPPASAVQPVKPPR